MIRAIYPGSFDPVTLGHLDIIKRAAQTVGELIVGVLNNGSKTPLFTIDERVSMLLEVTEGLSNVKVMSFSGLLVDFARQTNANVVVRGLRAISDFEYELQMAQTNRKMNPQASSEPRTAVVDQYGTVTAIQPGTALIIASTPSGAMATCSVRVVDWY